MCYGNYHHAFTFQFQFNYSRLLYFLIQIISTLASVKLRITEALHWKSYGTIQNNAAKSIAFNLNFNIIYFSDILYPRLWSNYPVYFPLSSHSQYFFISSTLADEMSFSLLTSEIHHLSLHLCALSYLFLYILPSFLWMYERSNLHSWSFENGQK